MRLHLPDPRLLQKTSDVDYYYWNYQFPIKYVQRFRFKAILSLIGADHYENLLEIGTGRGIFLPDLSKHCDNLYAIDIHDKLDAVKNLCDATGVKVVLKKKSIEQTDFPNGMFDALIGVSVLEFVENLEKAALEIKRIMKRNGYLITICPQRNAVLDFVLSLYSQKPPRKEFRHPPDEVQRTLTKHFHVIKRCIFPKVIGRVVPVYHYYKLSK